MSTESWSCSSTLFVSAFSTVTNVNSIHAVRHSEQQQQQQLSQLLPNTSRSRSRSTQLFADPNPQVAEAQDLLAKAQKLREEISESESGKASSPPASNTASSSVSDESTASNSIVKSSEWSVKYDDDSSPSLQDLQAKTYRLYLDIGREDGTWMDPRWGASGRRIEGTLDICLTSQVAPKEIDEKMVSDNQMGSSSGCFMVQSAKKARLKSGFDQMNVMEWDGGYRVDGLGGSTKSSQTLRFYLTVQGKQDGDISIPEGRLYFSLPCFVTGGGGGSSGQEPPQVILSNKEGIISVRQIGWHTGWRREESRILGVFRAVPIEKAQRMDGY